MQKTLFLFLAIFGVLCAAKSLKEKFSQSSPLRLLEKYATKSGQISLALGDAGFLAHVDFANHTSEASDTDDQNTDYGNMIPALYTEKTFFGMDCEKYEDYCHKYSSKCKNVSSNTSVVFPYFQSTGLSVLSEVILDYEHWFLNSNALASATCTQDITQGSYGLLGMGVKGQSLANFLGKRPTLAINIHKNLTNGSIAFDFSSSKVKSTTPVAQISSDDNWHIFNISSISVNRDTLDVGINMIFDLSSDSIGLPLNIYTQVIESIAKAPSMGGCSTNENFQPVCNFTGDIKRLPSVVLKIGNQTLEIPPRIYVVQTQESDFYYNPITLKFKILSTDPTQGSVVTPTYANYIILGYPVMSFYYTVFEGSQFGVGGAMISLYHSKEYSEANALTWIFIAVGVFGVILMGGVYYLVKRSAKKKKVYATPLLGAQNNAEVKAIRSLH